MAAEHVKWLNYILKTDKNIDEFFIDNNFKNIAIYGLGVLGNLFYDSIIKTNIEPTVFIDEKVREFRGKKTITVNQLGCITSIDCIVVCVTKYSAQTIMWQLKEKTSIKIFYLYEILTLMEYKNIFLPKAAKMSQLSFTIFDYPYLANLDNLSDIERILTSFSIKEIDLNNNKPMFSLTLKYPDSDSDRFLKQVFTQSPVIKLDNRLIHSDIQSEYVNIINGERLTVNVPNVYDQSIFIIGNCVVLGYGVDDKNTLASKLQKKLNKHGERVRVVNRGVWGVDALANIDFALEILEQNFPQNSHIMLNVWFHFEVYRDYITNYIRAITRDSAKNVSYIDCYDKFNISRKKLMYFDKVHLNSNGLELIADILSDKLFSENPYHLCGVDGSAQNNVVSKKSSNGVSIQPYLDYLQSQKVNIPGKIGSIVMNCNPFTNGHRYLIEQALKECDYLYVFVLEEDKSIFKYSERFALVEAGVSNLNNVSIIRGGQFIISTITFPEYFAKEHEKEKTINASGDLETFGKYIAPTLGISIRFVGSEPFCNITKQYNDSMKDILPQWDIEVKIIERVQSNDKAISASEVRASILNGDFKRIKQIVPATTYEFILSHLDELKSRLS